MKRSRLGIMVLCLLTVWLVAPAWSAEETAPATATTSQLQAGQQAAEPSAGQAAPEAQEAAPPAATQPASQPAAESAPAASSAAGGVQIQDAVVCQDVVDRAPVGSGDVFTKDIARVFCYCRVVGVEGESYVTHNWYYKGGLKASVKLPVHSNNWRTYSSKTVTPEWTGEWMVEILSESGTPLESIIFFVK